MFAFQLDIPLAGSRHSSLKPLIEGILRHLTFLYKADRLMEDVQDPSESLSPLTVKLR